MGGAGTGRGSPALCVSGAEFGEGPCSMAAGTAAALAFLSQESRTRAGGVGGLRVPAPVTMDSFFFGCELSGHTRSFTFKVEEEDDAEHVLALTMLCLTEGAKDECNVVEVVARNHDHQEIAVPVANLKLSCQPMLSLDDFQLQPPVTFRLKSGSGPVRITGRHQIVTMSNDVSEEESEEEEEDSDEEEAELCPILPAKKQGGRP
ncbi:nucleoplasmin-3 [Macaca nemestrina]|uniref:nucleoplasmin-3 n=1 Tax=Macaca nemestrina TaxID=9545 RepID=UPI0003ABA9EE|nr:nucleoplasmin-3 [Macaca nemestrina]